MPYGKFMTNTSKGAIPHERIYGTEHHIDGAPIAPCEKQHYVLSGPKPEEPITKARPSPDPKPATSSSPKSKKDAVAAILDDDFATSFPFSF